MTSPTRPHATSSSGPASVRAHTIPTARTASTMRASAIVIPPAAVAKQGVRAGLVSRVLAAALDAVVTLLLLCGGYLGLEVLYLTVCWATTGRTYGNHLMALRVVGRHGLRLHLVAAFVRAVAYALFPIGLAWVAVSRTNRSLQDIVLRTSVIYDWRE